MYIDVLSICIALKVIATFYRQNNVLYLLMHESKHPRNEKKVI